MMLTDVLPNYEDVFATLRKLVEICESKEAELLYLQEALSLLERCASCEVLAIPIEWCSIKVSIIVLI